MENLKKYQTVIAEKANGHFAAGAYWGRSIFTDEYIVIFPNGEERGFKDEASIIPYPADGRQTVLAMIEYRERQNKGEEV